MCVCISGGNYEPNKINPRHFLTTWKFSIVSCRIVHFNADGRGVFAIDRYRVEARLDPVKGSLEVFKGGQVQWSSSGKV